MFGKLLKYEFKSIGKWYLSLHAGSLMLSLILGFWIQSFHNRSGQSIALFNPAYSKVEGAVFSLTLLAFGLLIGGLFLITFFLIVARFQKSVYGRQGYLTMTLPVTSHQIILSKLVTSCIWYLFAGLSFLIDFSILFSGITGLLVNLPNSLQIYIDMIINVIMGILLAYFAISLGQLFKDYRILLAVIFYMGINFAINCIQAIYSVLSITATGSSSSSLTAFSADPVIIIFHILLAVGFYFGTHYIMTKRLNIQ